MICWCSSFFIVSKHWLVWIWFFALENYWFFISNRNLKKTVLTHEISTFKEIFTCSKLTRLIFLYSLKIERGERGRRGNVAATSQRRLSVRPSDVAGTSQMKHLTMSRWNVAKMSQWCVSTTSYWNVITTSQKAVTTMPHHYVSTTSQTSLKWNTQRRLDRTSSRRLSGTSPRRLIRTS